MDWISVRFDVRMIDLRGRGHVVPTEMIYRSDDPFAVHVIFDPDDVRERPWVVSRELVDDGLCSTVQHLAGDGDFRIGVCQSDCETMPFTVEDTVHIELNDVHNPLTPPVVLHAPFNKIASLLQDSYTMIPLGREPESYDYDEELIKLLS